MKPFKFPIDEKNYVQIEDGYDWGYRKIIVIYPYFPKREEYPATLKQRQLILSYIENYGDKPYPAIDCKLSTYIKEKVKSDRIQAHERLLGRCPSYCKGDATLEEILSKTLTCYQADRIIKAAKSCVGLASRLYYTDEHGQYEPMKWY